MTKTRMLIAVAIVAITAVFASAFTGKGHPSGVGKGRVYADTLFWYEPTGGSLSYDARMVREDEVDHSGCPDDGSYECRKGYLPEQLNNPANPSLGVKTTEINNPQDIIYKVVP